MGQVGPLDLLGLTRSLVDIDSTTGKEHDAGAWIAQFLRDRGYLVAEQPVSEDTLFPYTTLFRSRKSVV